jgi:hypothetical protein
MELSGFNISALNAIWIQRFSQGILNPESKGYLDLHPHDIGIDHASFSALHNSANFPDVHIALRDKANDSMGAGASDGGMNRTLTVSCSCSGLPGKLCLHAAQVLYNIAYRDELRVFFDESLRLRQLTQFALPYGMQDEERLDRYFHLQYGNGKATIQPTGGLVPFTRETTALLEEQLLPGPVLSGPAGRAQSGPAGRTLPAPEHDGLAVVFRQHKYYKHLCISLFRAPVTYSGKIKNPLMPMDPADFIWREDDNTVLKFYTGISRFQNNHTTPRSAAGLEALKAIVKNPQGLGFFSHKNDASENITAASVEPVTIGGPIHDLNLFVHEKGNFYALSGSVRIDGLPCDIRDLVIRHDYFVARGSVLHLVPHIHFLKVIEFFRLRPDGILIHASKFPEFRGEILDKLAETVNITYDYLKTATKEQLENSGLTRPPDKIIYLSDSAAYVLIDPVMKYGETEIPLFSKKQIQAKDEKGKLFTIERDKDGEDGFMSLLVRQHPHFAEQLDGELPYFYLHKDRFLDDDWFLNAFEQWADQGITVLGFNQLKDNRRSPYKAAISINVASGLNWFNTVINVRFGKQKVNVGNLHKSIRNKNRFVQLDDGTMGILPGEWIEKFSDYFNAGEVIDGELLTPKINFSSIDRLYDPGMIDEEVRAELKEYHARFSSFRAIKAVPVPEGLNATLRHYQQEGLNWLNFLDDLNFGGCLADDMGLGKSIQVIAFILSQRKKTLRNTNLVVVPTSLIFNWQQEVEKFAPSIPVYTLYGAERNKSAGKMKNMAELDQYEIVLTSYGALLSDIAFLRHYTFNYVFLDESQNIKNPDSQRYHTVRQLTSRNKIVLSGTPVENNTLDLYGQLSFACPGLLGTRQYFRDIYSIPIDRFKDTRRAIELQNKVHPFILRRTKAQVAGELPEKIEMVLYCPMDEKQRAVYDLYEKGLRDFLLSGSADDFPNTTMHVLKGLTQLRQICNSPALLDTEKLYDDSSSKIDILMEQVDNLVPDHKILIFSQFVSMLNLIRKELTARNIGFQYLTGATRDRASAVSDFQANDAVRVFLISLKAGGTGLNLTGADYVFLMDPWWNPAVENQAIDRSYRMGQKNNVVAVRLICPDTVEEKIRKLQESKKELVNDLIKTDASILKSLTREGLLSLLKS